MSKKTEVNIVDLFNFLDSDSGSDEPIQTRSKVKKVKKIPLSKKFKIVKGSPITDLKSLIHAFEHPKATVKQKEFVASLRDLDSMIGMDTFKEQLINQILFFVQDLQDPNTFLHTVITGPPGTGKCLGYGTKVIMYSGKIKEVQEIQVGDLLMGDDSKPRTVKSICKGTEPMYIVKQLIGDNYIVNKSHILSLVVSDSFKLKEKVYHSGDIIDISVKEYLELSEFIKYRLKGYKASIQFEEKEISTDPYSYGKNIQGCFSIPDNYKYNTRSVHLQLLAGIIDTYGYYDYKKGCFKVPLQKELVPDIVFIIRCLGMIPIASAKYLYIYGNEIASIPTRVRITIPSNMNTHTDITVLPVPLGYYDQGPEYNYYYGFEIDGNHRFLLGDHTVTHNTRAINILANIYCNLGILETNNVIKADRSSLIGKWCGHTAIKTKEVLESAKGGVLILDEVYSLGSKDRNDSFSKECIDTINQYLSEHVDDFICVIAGYKDLVQDYFFDSNPGLERRFPWRFNINPYTAEELTEIFKLQVNDCNWYIADDLEDSFITRTIKENLIYFSGNGGDTRNLIDKCKIINARKTFTTMILGNEDSDQRKKRKARKDSMSPSTNRSSSRLISKEDFINGMNIFIESKKDIGDKVPDFVSSWYI